MEIASVSSGSSILPVPHGFLLKNNKEIASDSSGGISRGGSRAIPGSPPGVSRGPKPSGGMRGLHFHCKTNEKPMKLPEAYIAVLIGYQDEKGELSW